MALDRAALERARGILQAHAIKNPAIVTYADGSQEIVSGADLIDAEHGENREIWDRLWQAELNNSTTARTTAMTG